MNKCKNCQAEGKLELIKDYQYQFEEDSPIEIIDVLKCSVCGCIHWETSTSLFYEYKPKEREEINNIGKWATNSNKKELV